LEGDIERIEDTGKIDSYEISAEYPDDMASFG